MHSLLQHGIGYRHDSKDNNRLICNLLLYKLQIIIYPLTCKYLSEYLYKYSEGGGAKPPQ